jgi:serine/threonine protein kinase
MSKHVLPDHPERIGPYRIVQVIGEGGMGVVFDAEQREPVRRRVAIKMMKVGMDTREVVTRFEAERQALALMDHANIAKVFDGGATEEGRPYFVMERVRGIDLDDYCDEHLLTVRERIELFIDICDAVQHAHQKGIIHRDLKPSNILVADADGVPTPKVIDFGIAKATGQRLTDRTAVTTYGQTVGTLSYMSPEQAEMDGLDVDTRTDVYSLGIMLFELLAGRVPLDPGEVGAPVFLAGLIQRDKSLPTAVQVLRTLDEDRLERVATARSTSRSALERAVAGDLRWVLLKATEKDRTRRYQTASELAQDLRRYLNDEPISARAPSATYRLRKFVRRHRAGAAVAAAGIVAVLVGSVGATVGMVRAQRAEAAAALEAETAVRVSEFLTDLFEVSDPSNARGASVTAREMLDSGAVRVRSDLADQPALQARLMTVIGDVYRSLGLYEQGQPLLEEALALYESDVDEEQARLSPRAYRRLRAVASARIGGATDLP